MLATAKYDEKFNSLKLMRANQEFLSREKELEVSKLKTESHLKISQRNYAIIIVILLLGGSVFAYWSRNRYLMKKQELIDLALRNSQKDLEHARRELHKVVKKLNQNNEMILQLNKGKLEKADRDLLEELKSTSILTQEDWIQYREMFQNAYPNFIMKLKSSFPDLSPAEKRCLCLEKLKMSNNEMALALGVSANTVIVTKHRIRKKLGLTSQEELSALVNGLN
jgi:DNA-binding CsgD family transcriptional regulator